MKVLKKIVEKTLGPRGAQNARYVMRVSRFMFLKLINKFPFFGRLYILFFTTSYNREINAVFAGQLAHIRNKMGGEGVNFHLRRSVHRLEKGLSMHPRRPIFGLKIINPTIKSYKKTLHQNGGKCNSELIWAHDVLTEYFNVCASHPVIDNARNEFESTRIQYENKGAKVPMIPYDRRFVPELTVTYDQFYTLAKRRRSVRWYEDKVVDRSLIDKAVSVAGLSPSACNRQPYTFRIIDDPQLLTVCRKLPMGVKGYADNIPVLIAVIGNLKAYSEARDRHVIYIDGSLASMSFMFAAETLGLATCTINWSDMKLREERAAKILGLSKDQRIIMWIALGYPIESGKIPYSAKTELDNIRIFN